MFLPLRLKHLIVLCVAILLLLHAPEAQAQTQDTLILSKGTTIYLTEGSDYKYRKRQGFDVFSLRATYIPTSVPMIRKGDRWVISWRQKKWAFVSSVTGLSGYIEDDNGYSYWDELAILNWHRDKHFTQMLSVHSRTEARIVWPDECESEIIYLLPRQAYRAIDSAPDGLPGVLIAPNEFSVECGSVTPSHFIVQVPPQSFEVYFMPQSVALSAQGESVGSDAIEEATRAYQTRSRRRLRTADISGGCVGTQESVEFTDEDRTRLIASISAQLNIIGLGSSIEREQIIKMVREITFSGEQEYSAFFFGVLEPKGIARIMTKGPCGKTKEFFYGASDSLTATRQISFADFAEFNIDDGIIYLECAEQFVKAQQVLGGKYHLDRI